MIDVINELKEMLFNCEVDGEEEGEFANQLRKAIRILEEESE